MTHEHVWEYFGTLCMSVFTQVPAAVLYVFVTGRRETGVAHQRLFKTVDAGTFLRWLQRPRCFECSLLHFQAISSFLHLVLCSPVEFQLVTGSCLRHEKSPDSGNELLKLVFQGSLWRL